MDWISIYFLLLGSHDKPICSYNYTKIQIRIQIQNQIFQIQDPNPSIIPIRWLCLTIGAPLLFVFGIFYEKMSSLSAASSISKKKLLGLG